MTFPALCGGGAWLRHTFVLRQAGVNVEVEREEVLARLAESHRAAVRALGFGASALALAEQVHGASVARVDNGGVTVARADGLVCATPGCVLGIHVADCCAVFLVDPVRRAIGLIHSGRRGSELGIVSRAIAAMEREFGTPARDLIVQLSPCIRPPLYEVDFAAMICRDAHEAGVPSSQIHDTGLCTGSDLDRFYSYRVERGRTGRLLALLGIL
jgi:purine-nucleoside/S-methyl-5'-thioadenosine phosphorylase / adenosine deaminase